MTKITSGQAQATKLEQIQATLDLASRLAEGLARLALADPEFAENWLEQSVLAAKQVSYLNAAKRLATTRADKKKR